MDQEGYKSTAGLEYSAWKIITIYRDSSLDGVNGLRFNKMMALLNHGLLDEKGLDIRLPRCWYLNGETTIPKQLSEKVEWSGLDEEEEETLVFWHGDKPSLRSSRDRKKIDSIADSLYSLHPPEGDVKDAIEEDYRRYAPYDFQRLYKVFRHDTDIRTLVVNNGSFRSKAFYAEEIRKAMEAFPSAEFPELKVEAVKVNVLLSCLFEEHPEENKKGIEIAGDFWRIFCRFLRVKENHHVSSDRVEHWRKIAFDDLTDYRIKLKKDINMLKGLDLSISRDPMIDVFLSPENLGFKDLSTHVDEFVYG